MYKVDNAVIMAAGTSSRFAPLSYETHKSLLTVRGEVLIERQIRQIKDAGIDSVVLVGGYMKERFAYLREKFGVTIIDNPEYTCRNNHSSIYAARHLLGNSYICSSDNYFSRNPFESCVDDAYYAALYADGPTSEWCVYEGDDGYIDRVSVGGENAWYMMGHVFWSEPFSRKFVEILEREYDTPEIRDKLWEAVYAAHLDELKLRIRRYDAQDIFEFDSLDELRGFDASVRSTVLPGSGLSSSAAFEVLIGTILNELFFDRKLTAVEIAQIGQYAENVYFGKPSGLMDQTASSVGGLVFIDFADPQTPLVERVEFDFAHCGYTPCILDSGADHADLTDEYAAIPQEMRSVARCFGKEVLREVNEAEFYAQLKQVREQTGDRAVLRAMHFFDENRRVLEQVQALKNGDFEGFLAGVRDSGRSSWMLLQNIIPLGSTAHQQMALAQALCEKLLDGRGACRVHGGGFAGTILAFVPDEMLGQFRSGAEAVLGAGSCHVLSIRQTGGTRLG